MYYLYRHIRPDKNEVFYVGIGKVNTIDINSQNPPTFFRRAYSKFNRNKYWKEIVNLNSNYIIEIIMESQDENFIKNKEIEFISLYKRKSDGGTLCNFSLGGEGNFGLVHSKESKLKMSLSKKGKPSKLKGRKLSKERVQLMINTFKGKPNLKNRGKSYKNSGRKPKCIKRSLNGEELIFRSPKEAADKLRIPINTIYLWVGEFQKPRNGAKWEYIKK